MGILLLINALILAENVPHRRKYDMCEYSGLIFVDGKSYIRFKRRNFSERTMDIIIAHLGHRADFDEREKWGHQKNMSPSFVKGEGTPESKILDFRSSNGLFGFASGDVSSFQFK